MKKHSRALLVLLFSISFLFVAVTDATSEEYAALKGLKSVKAVFDVRAGNPKGAKLYLKLIHETFKDKNIRAVTEEPEFVVVFIGPSVKLVSKNREGFSAEENKMLDEIASTVSVMSKDGIRFEICMFAAKYFQVEAGSILPEIKQVENGWISLIGYEALGYSLVPVY